MTGLGYYFRGHTRVFLIAQGTIWILLFIICWTKLVFISEVLYSYVLCVLAIHLLITATSFSIIKSEKYKVKRDHQTIKTLIVFIITSSLFITCFFQKKHVLGVEIYFIPSFSMAPTLLPGDYILVNTNAYTHSNPQLSNLVVFKHPDRNIILIKRISKWPHNQNILFKNEFFLTGDNSQQSIDSRQFGGIPLVNIAGKAELILIASSSHSRSKYSSTEYFKQL